MKRLSILSVAATVAALALIPSTQAKAGFMVEPGVGWNFFNSESSSGAKSSANGFGADLRAGFTFSHFAIGASGNFSLLTSSSATAGTPASQWLNIGAFAQFTFPAFPLTLRAVYNFVDDLGVTVPPLPKAGAKGYGIRFGLGYKIVPKLALNVDYVINKFTDGYLGSTTTPIPSASQDKSDNDLLITLSVPLGM
ncbi:MAG TPA: outer membrane beta-barrel protein [Bdellovibrionota bacterium]|jgi:hypothetical protein|nr:outer membrane beta-barrel protein [Bdellovibrionota bacterium]